MRQSFGLAAGLAVMGIAHLATAADIVGVITLKGTPPPEKEITEVKEDALFGPLHPEPLMTRFYVVGPKGELADVVVSLKGISGKSAGASAAPLVIDQKGCEFQPCVAAVQTKQKILVKNSDPLPHTVHDTPVVAGNKEHNLAMPPNTPDLTFVFDAPEDFLRFKCDVHAWMFAYVSVFDHPYFAVSGKDGTFRIANVPPGKYTLEARHRKAGVVTRDIEVKDDGAKIDLVFELKRPT